MVDGVKFWDDYAERYAASPVKHEEGYQDTLARIRKHVAPGASILEVGCGTGTTALKLAGDFGAIVATDVSQRMVDIARAKADAAGVRNVKFAVSSTHDAPGGEGCYDAVAALNLFQLVEDIPGAIARLGKQIRPGGMFVSKSTALGESWLLRLVIPVLQLFGKAPHVSFFTRDGLQRMFVDAGFEIVEAHDYPKEWLKRRLIFARKPAE